MMVASPFGTYPSPTYYIYTMENASLSFALRLHRNITCCRRRARTADRSPHPWCHKQIHPSVKAALPTELCSMCMLSAIRAAHNVRQVALFPVAIAYTARCSIDSFSVVIPFAIAVSLYQLVKPSLSAFLTRLQAVPILWKVRDSNPRCSYALRRCARLFVPFSDLYRLLSTTQPTFLASSLASRLHRDILRRHPQIPELPLLNHVHDLM